MSFFLQNKWKGVFTVLLMSKKQDLPTAWALIWAQTSLHCYQRLANPIATLVIPFKDGITFVVTTATQSLQQCYLENVADVTYVAVTKCHFWNIFLNFWIKNAHTSGPEAIGGHWGSKTRSRTWFYDTQNHQKS